MLDMTVREVVDLLIANLNTLSPMAYAGIYVAVMYLLSFVTSKKVYKFARYKDGQCQSSAVATAQLWVAFAPISFWIMMAYATVTCGVPTAFKPLVKWWQKEENVG